MAYAKPDVIENRLLAALPRKDRQHVLAACEPVSLEFSDVLYEPYQRIRYVYFPLDCFASLIITTYGEDRLEISMVGNEGMLGAPLVLDIDVPLLHVIVQGPGTALRMKSAAFKHELENSLPFQRVLRRYVYVVMRQLAQTASCMRFHLLEERLARWLLMTQDRAQSSVLHLTQEFLSYMLGVRRVGISKAATSLQERNLISYSRGEIRILDRRGLIAASCACYQADLIYYSKMLHPPSVAVVNRRASARPDARHINYPIIGESHKHHVSSGLFL